MKSNKTTLLIFAVLLSCAALFNGCLNYYQETKLKTDGSGEMFVHYWMKLKTPQDSAIIKQTGVFIQDSVRNEFSSKYNEIKNIEVYSDTTDSTVHAKVELAFNSIDSLSHTRAFAESNLSLKDGAENQKIFSQFITPAATGFGIDAGDISITYVYYLPGDIITHNANELSGNKLTWSYKMSDIGNGKTITATFRPFKLKETPLWVYALALGVLIVVVIFLFKKNKS